MGIVFLLFPFLEIFLFIEAGDRYGFINVLLYFVLAFVIGVRMIKWASQKAMRNPSLSSVKSLIWILVGFLLLVPGFLTDLLAFLLAFPPTRYLIFKGQAEKAARWANGKVNVFFSSGAQGAGATFYREDIHVNQERDAKVIDIQALPSQKKPD